MFGSHEYRLNLAKFLRLKCHLDRFKYASASAQFARLLVVIGSLELGTKH
uniref:Uncharacterized protein n=1 Tax=Arundo donax TaxID=35708 RepID=A0A0A9A2A6_ARUDO